MPTSATDVGDSLATRKLQEGIGSKRPRPAVDAWLSQSPAYDSTAGIARVNVIVQLDPSPRIPNANPCSKTVTKSN